MAQGDLDAREEMLRRGYLPAEDYFGIMALNKELREQHKQLRAELVALRVEQERLRMDERFLRETAERAGLTPPPEVPAAPLVRSALEVPSSRPATPASAPSPA